MIDRKEAKQQGLWIGDFLLKISPDDMLIYMENEEGDPEFVKNLKENWEYLKSRLQEEGIKGILPEPEVIEDKIIVAKGTPPKPPISEKYELTEKFLPLLEEIGERYCEKLIKSLEKEYSKEDLRELCKKIICAEKDEVIAKWFPAVPGVPGFNVWGEPLEPPKLKEEKTISLGENLYLDEKEHLVKTKVSGVVKFENYKLEVYPEYEVKGDVDFSIGNIYFKGKKLTIKGDVKFGFKIISKGDLILEGCTENKVYIEVKGNFVCKGIIRGERTVVKVEGDAEIKGIEYAQLDIKGNLKIKDYLIFSNTFVNGDLEAISGKGIVYGGEVKVSGNAEVKILGNESQTATKFLAGYNPDLIEPYLSLVQKKLILKENLMKISYGIMLGERLKEEGRMSPEKEKIWLKLREEYEKAVNELNSVREQVQELEKKIKELKTRTIRIKEKVFPGVTLGIAEISMVIPEEKRGPLEFYLEADVIQFREIFKNE